MPKKIYTDSTQILTKMKLAGECSWGTKGRNTYYVSYPIYWFCSAGLEKYFDLTGARKIRLHLQSTKPKGNCIEVTIDRAYQFAPDIYIKGPKGVLRTRFRGYAAPYDFVLKFMNRHELNKCWAYITIEG